MDPGPVARLVRALPDVEISESWSTVGRRLRGWTWPAVQMGIAAAASWWLASRVANDAAGYAPITAIVGLGLGRERRLGRAALLVSGLLLGVVAAEIATAAIGAGWWQVGVSMTVAAACTAALIGRDLAVTYAAINAVVLLTTPGSDGWFPSRLVAGLVGVAVAVAVMLVVAPARPVHLVRHRLGRAAARAGEALATSADDLEHGLDEDDPDGDDRPPIALARRLDDEIEQSHATVDQAGELVRWSPWRRRDAAEVERLARIARQLRPALRTASTIARLADRALLVGVSTPAAVPEAVRGAAEAMERLTRHLLEGSPPTVGEVDTASEVVDRLMSAEVDHAVLVAMKEEVRGLLSDLDTIVEVVFDDAPTTRHRLDTAHVGNIDYGRH